jgi:hypothetical protein
MVIREKSPVTELFQYAFVNKNPFSGACSKTGASASRGVKIVENPQGFST